MAARRILPFTVLGSASTYSTMRGYLYGAVLCFTQVCSSRVSSEEPSKPSAKTTVAFTALPRVGSGTPVTAHSRTASCSRSTLSISKGPMR